MRFLAANAGRERARLAAHRARTRPTITRTPTAAGTHREVWAGQRKTLGGTTGVAGTGARSQPGGSPGGERAPPGASYEQSFQLEVEPAKYFVLVSQREKRACK